ncbi:MAG TPA: helix-turn-helix transcriptional regulator [Candidatus Acidoferrum sp.]|jgi:transcriptional regulator with XRE-family HTH domain|nr:helix-turn-helix transcriptional regulator [Candidatus Acidoferrum sp.]
MYPNLKLQLFRKAVRQNYLARELGIDESFLSKIIHGYREPSAALRQLLANYLGANESWLFEKYEADSSLGRLGKAASETTEDFR